ncbi:hypothetical protein VTL71DRAFT_6943 [Oculimacula yallundae]|uniref:Uncharacterized protein n=1 Tax=Oculimacula yallundae TaxID=86028 RepID=A0ABR4BWG1_9HELO
MPSLTLNSDELILLALALEKTPNLDRNMIAERLGIKLNTASKRWSKFKEKIIKAAGEATDFTDDAEASEADVRKNISERGGKRHFKVKNVVDQEENEDVDEA